METLNRRVHSVLKQAPRRVLFGPRDESPLIEVEFNPDVLTLEEFKTLAKEFNTTS
ncbi:hypothetical protein ADUPG1_005340, partial [Aduncisulcus paluster]